MTLELIVRTGQLNRAKFIAPIDESIPRVIVYVATPGGQVLRMLELDAKTLRARGDWL